jgi:hypothetical protein
VTLVDGPDRAFRVAGCTSWPPDASAAPRTVGRHYGDSFTIEIPNGSGNRCTLVDAADLIDSSLTALFRPVDGKRPADGGRIEASDSSLWREHPTFSEFCDGDTGEGLGATHQTGWTALVAHLLNPRRPPDPR